MAAGIGRPGWLERAGAAGEAGELERPGVARPGTRGTVRRLVLRAAEWWWQGWVQYAAVVARRGWR